MHLEIIKRKKAKLDKHRPLSRETVRSLEDWLRVELTYTSNGIEGNTLTRAETAVVLSKGITIGGKTLKEHLEATNHAGAYDWVLSFISKSSQKTKITENDILHIHQLILKSIDDDNAGRYRKVPVRIAGSRVILPNYLKVSKLMKDFTEWLNSHEKEHPVERAIFAHFKLVSIHPFSDGNGRTARLLMNLLLMQYGFPPAIIRKKDRVRYLNALEKAQLNPEQPKSLDDYNKLLLKAVERSLDIYLNALEKTKHPTIEDLDDSNEKTDFLKIGELAKLGQVTVTTIRHWASLGLIDVAEKTDSGYMLFEKSTLERIKLIKKYQEQRLTLEEIATRLKI